MWILFSLLSALAAPKVTVVPRSDGESYVLRNGVIPVDAWSFASHYDPGVRTSLPGKVYGRRLLFFQGLLVGGVTTTAAIIWAGANGNSRTRNVDPAPYVMGLSGGLLVALTIPLAATDKQIRKSLARAATDPARVTREDVGDELTRKNIDPQLSYRGTVTLANGTSVQALTLWEAYRDHLTVERGLAPNSSGVEGSAALARCRGRCHRVEPSRRRRPSGDAGSPSWRADAIGRASSQRRKNHRGRWADRAGRPVHSG